MCWNLDDSKKESGEEKEGKTEEVEDGNASKNLFITMRMLDYRFVDLFRSDLIVDRVEVDVGEEGGQGDQQGHLKRQSQRKTETSKRTQRESQKIRAKNFH